MEKFILPNICKKYYNCKMKGHFSNICHSCPSSRPPSNDKIQLCKDFHEVTQLDDTDGNLFIYHTDVAYFHFSTESNDCKEVAFDEINGQLSRLMCQLNVSKSNIYTGVNFKLDMGESGNLLPYKYFKYNAPMLA